ncbi:Mrr N-terminal domain-containing protein [Armatimonadetes bacterium DC]|jgi:DNA-binding Lrp family transcriptional regulator|nr:Mrr N-terminal domain-containing protein [Armatimonadetes bacterium DC]
MFQDAQQARDWLKEQGYPVQESLINSPPQLKPSASKHISEWIPLVKIETPDYAPFHIYWVRFKQECGTGDLRYVVDAYLKKYPQVLTLFIGSHYRKGKWGSLLMCPEPQAKHWYHACVTDELTPRNERLLKALQYNPAEPVETLWRRVYRTLRGETMNARIKEAFESFIMELENIRAEIDAEIQHATQHGDYIKVQELAREAEQLKELIGKVQQLRAGNTTVNSTTKSARSTRDNEDATPKKAFIIPLLQALVDLDGEAPKRKVLERIQELTKDQLKPADYEELPSGGKIRWKSKVTGLRNKLIKQGYLRADTPQGIWAITDKGRQYLEQLKNS